jgi:hypothetical protein
VPRGERNEGIAAECSGGRYDARVNGGSLSPRSDAGPSAGTIVGLLIGVAGVALCLTFLFLGMRSVLAVGGSCSDGGPYVSAQPCPSGTPVVMLVGIFGLFGFGGLASWSGIKVGGIFASIPLMIWSALFLSLGWNFLQYGLAAEGGPDLGLLICAVIFGVMGGVPLLALLPASASSRTGPSLLQKQRLANDLAARRDDLAPTDGDGTTADSTGPTAPAGDLASRLERLSALHASGSLSDVEFEDAKRRVIGEVAAGR